MNNNQTDALLVCRVCMATFAYTDAGQDRYDEHHCEEPEGDR